MLKVTNEDKAAIWRSFSKLSIETLSAYRDVIGEMLAEHTERPFLTHFDDRSPEALAKTSAPPPRQVLDRWERDANKPIA